VCRGSAITGCRGAERAEGVEGAERDECNDGTGDRIKVTEVPKPNSRRRIPTSERKA
jgi:hypothetical protein